jgi:ribosomal protein S18 acetylase RimI-like enzyme
MITTNEKPTSSTYTWRAAERGDLPGIQAVLAALAAEIGNPSVPALADLENEFEEPWSQPATDTRLALAADGIVAAHGRVYANPAPEEAARAFLDCEIHPAHRSRELEDSLFDWLEARGRAKLAEVAAASGFRGPRTLRTGADSEDRAALALFARRGFEPVRYFYRMRRDLGQPIPETRARLPAGLALHPYLPEQDEAIRRALNEAFSDHWQFEAFTPDDWRQFFIQRSKFRPDLTRIVLDGGEVAAFSINEVDPAENERQGYSTGWIQSLGTRRAWRKRGLASSLLVESMRAFLAEGLQFATLRVDAENPTGALGLYERLGFVTFRQTVAYAKELPSANGQP